MNHRAPGIALAALMLGSTSARAQTYPPDPLPGEQRSSNIHVIGHLPLTVSSPYNIADIEMEQELSRPYVYISHPNEAAVTNPFNGFDIISIKDPSKPRLIYSWHIENEALHKGPGSLGPAYVKTKGRYYFIDGFQFRQGGPDVDLGAIVWDVTGLPDTSRIK